MKLGLQSSTQHRDEKLANNRPGPVWAYLDVIPIVECLPGGICIMGIIKLANIHVNNGCMWQTSNSLTFNLS